MGAAIHVCPNASRVLLNWGFDAKRARLVTVRRSQVVHANSLQVFSDVDSSSVAAKYGAPWFFAHRLDLHSELRRLASSDQGPGSPVEIILRAEVVDYDALTGSVTLADGSVHHAELVVAADGIHTLAMKHVVGHSTAAGSTGAAAFRFLIPTEQLSKDPNTALLAKDNDGVMKILAGDGLKRLVWYPCAEYDISLAGTVGSYLSY